MSITAAELVARVTADTSAAERDLRAFSSRLTSGGGPLGSIGTTMAGVLGGNLLTGAVSGLTRGLMDVGRAGVGVFMDMVSSGQAFEFEMDSINALLGSTGEEAAALKDLVLDLSANPSLKVDIEGAAGAIKNLGAAGISVDDILGGVAETTVLLANATGSDIPTAAKIAADAMSIFNLESERAIDVANGVIAVSNAGKFDIQDYGLFMGNAAGVAATFGVSLEDMNTVMALSSASFTSGQTAGTGFKTMLQRLQPTTKEQVGLFRDLNWLTEDGTSIFYDSTGALKDMDDVAGILNATFADMTEQQKSFYAGQIFGADAQQMVLELAKSTTEQFAAVQEQMGKTDALVAAKTATDNAASAWEAFGDTINATKVRIWDAVRGDELSQRLAQAFSGAVNFAAPYLEAWATQFGDWAERTIADIQFRGNAAKVAFDNAFNWSQAAGEPLNMSWAEGLDAAIEQFFGPSSAIARAADRLPALVARFNESGGGFSGWASAITAGAGMLAGADTDMAAFSTSLGELDDAVDEFSKKGDGTGLFAAIVGGVAAVSGAQVKFDQTLGEMSMSWDNFTLKMNEKGLEGFQWGTLEVNWQEGKVTVGGQDVGAWLHGALSADKIKGYLQMGAAALDMQMNLKVKPMLEDGSASMGAWLDKSAASIGEGIRVTVKPLLEGGSASLAGWLNTQAAAIGAGITVTVKTVADWGETWAATYLTQANVLALWADTWTHIYATSANVAALWGTTWTTIYKAVARILPDWGNTFTQVYQAVVNLIPNWLGGGPDAGPTGGVAVPGLRSDQSYSDRNNYGGNPIGKATGDPLWKGGWTMVGERGPELVRLPRASRIYNDLDSQRMAGGTVINNYTQVRSDADLELLVRRTVRALARGA